MNYKDYLTEDVLPFWLDHAIDEDQGGIFTCLDRFGQIYGTEKSVWFQGRALWTFSKAYNLVEKNERYRKAADTIYGFLSKCEDTDGRMYFTVTREGHPIQKRRYYYSETFAAIGCAEYYKATGKEEAWEKAEHYFDIAWRCFRDPSLNPAKFRIAMKAHGPVMIMMATARSLAGVGRNREKYEEIAKELCNELLWGGYISREADVLLENVLPDGRFSDTPTGRLVNPGHSLETAWFLMGEGLIRKNDEVLAAAKTIVDMTMPIGVDPKHGGIIAFADALGKPPTALEWDMKLWWPQNEAIIANRLAYEIFGEEIYREQYESLTELAFRCFADREGGEWYGYLHYDNTVSNTLKGNIFKGPFHLPRMLMILDQLERKKSPLGFWQDTVL